MPSRFLVRAARRDDAPALAAIAIDAWAASAFAELDASRTDHEALRRTFTDFCQTHHARILVAEGQDGVLGWGARENGDFHISDLWVGPSAQGQGAGTALLEALEVGIAKAAYNFVELETYAGNVGALWLPAAWIPDHLAWTEIFRQPELRIGQSASGQVARPRDATGHRTA
jgi:ribosomal-protein-alanine N-acetyltransferase